MSYVPYTERERQHVAILAELGKSTPAIARALGVTIDRVYNLSIVTQARRQAGVRNREGVARLFGVNTKTPIHWQRRGWLPTRVKNGGHIARSGKKPVKPHHLFTDAHIETFMRRRETWPSWEPQLITDPYWRELALEIRAAAGGRWMTTAELSARFGYVETTVLLWRRRFAPDATVKYGSAVFWWSAAVERFVPPLERTR